MDEADEACKLHNNLAACRFRQSTLRVLPPIGRRRSVPGEIETPLGHKAKPFAASLAHGLHCALPRLQCIIVHRSSAPARSSQCLSCIMQHVNDIGPAGAAKLPLRIPLLGNPSCNRGKVLER